MDRMLVALRKTKGWNQAQAGEQLMNELAAQGKSIKHTYATKKISLFESNTIRPTAFELQALSKVYGVDPKEIDVEFTKAPLDAVSLMEALIQSGRRTLIAAIYGGRQRISSNPEFHRVLKEALMSGIHLGMFFPYPLGQSLKVGVGNDDDKWNLTHVYEDVYMHAWGRYKSLCEGIQPDKRGQLAFYEPNLDPKMPVPMYLPPYASRITLVVQVMEDGSITQNLYSWIETEEVDAFFRLGTFADINVEQQFLAWQAYFGTPLEDWKLTHGFHDEENGFWRRKILNQSTNTA